MIRYILILILVFYPALSYSEDTPDVKILDNGDYVLSKEAMGLIWANQEALENKVNKLERELEEHECKEDLPWAVFIMIGTLSLTVGITSGYVLSK